MKKKVLLVMTSMNTGGIASSIRNMIALLPASEYEFDLLLFTGKNNANVEAPLLEAGKFMRLCAISQRQAFQENFFQGLYRTIILSLTKLFGHGLSYSILLNHTMPIDKQYDVAISCTQSAPYRRLYGGCNEFVLKKVTAKKKVAFIHCDYKLYGLDEPYSHKVYSKMDAIAAVSKSVRDSFLECEPTFKEKTHVVLNLCNYDHVRLLAKQNPVQYKSDVVNIVTVARMGNEKGHKRMLSIIHKLAKEQEKFLWHVVGGTAEEAGEGFCKTLKDYDIEKYIVFHGNQDNPYRFMVNADFLLIPSYHEAAPMVYEEAHALNLPILTTETLSARELVEEKGLGIVCPNDDDSLENALQKIIREPAIIDRYRKMMEGTVSNEDAFRQNINLLSGE